jgi:hypothetical protein
MVQVPALTSAPGTIALASAWRLPAFHPEYVITTDTWRTLGVVAEVVAVTDGDEGGDEEGDEGGEEDGTVLDWVGMGVEGAGELTLVEGCGAG